MLAVANTAKFLTMPIKTTIKKVLIANRGEIAARILRGVQAAGMQSVAIYHPLDRHALHVQQADEAIELTADNPSAAYLDIEQIISICTAHNVDAVHPGYGFLSENALFAAALEKNNIAFIGPKSDVIKLMGDKIRAREFVIKQGVNVPPSTDLAINDPNFDAAIAEMELPLLVKASAGGGGKGMSIVRSNSELSAALELATAEAEKHFGDGRVYIEQYFESARHIEVQVLGDGNDVIHLGERDCSVQRRFQKVIEEAPASNLSDRLRQELCDAAVTIAKAAKYLSAGTVEFLVTPNEKFYFLEMNTRLQVEHGVTELITGIDLVAQQLDLASGNSLSLKQNDIKISGHAIECRICAEDPFDGFMPQTGKIMHLDIPQGAQVRIDSGIQQGQTVSPAFDSMLAKLLIHAEDRHSTIAQSIKALSDFTLLGITTNIDFLATVLAHPQFETGNIDTHFIDNHETDLIQQKPDSKHLQVVLAAALLSDPKVKQAMQNTPSPYLDLGAWRN